MYICLDHILSYYFTIASSTILYYNKLYHTLYDAVLQYYHSTPYLLGQGRQDADYITMMIIITMIIIISSIIIMLSFSISIHISN